MRRVPQKEVALGGYAAEHRFQLRNSGSQAVHAGRGDGGGVAEQTRKRKQGGEEPAAGFRHPEIAPMRRGAVNESRSQPDAVVPVPGLSGAVSDGMDVDVFADRLAEDQVGNPTSL